MKKNMKISDLHEEKTWKLADLNEETKHRKLAGPEMKKQNIEN